jgi:autotransporter-associated beta strand protein
LEDRLAPATLVVNTLADSIGGSQLSLRDAIRAVNGGGYNGPATGQVSGTFGNNDKILFQSGLNGTLSLVTGNGPLVISSDVTITANPGLDPITISGQFAGSGTGVFEVTSPASARIAGLTITQGEDSTLQFGAVYVQAGGALTVDGCTFVNNQSAGPGGGAILNDGTLTVTDSTFNANSGSVGGAIDNLTGATATLINCTISGNQATSASGTGGGVANAGSLTLLNTVVAQNTTAGTDPDVVGAFNSSGHNLIGNSTGATGLTNGINGDQVGSAAPFTGDLTSGLATIENVSSTAGLVVGQLVTDTAGALPAGTIIAVLGSHSITLSQAATKSQTGVGFTSSIYADLGPLQNNGGGIQTMALLPTSSAIDAGTNSDPVLTVPTTDERGVSRPQAGTVDIGAFEANELLVTNLNDSGAGSLRDALTQSNSIPGTVVIDFQAGLTGTISLTTGHLEIVHDDWIRGPGAALITVDGNLNYWCFGVDTQYAVGAPGLHVAIYGLTMTRGEQVTGLNDSRGGAISYRNTFPYSCLLTVANCVIENSVNDGIYAEDNLSVINCKIVNNTGQGIYGGTPYVSNSWLAGNSKEGLNGFNNLVLANSTFSGNGTDGVYMGNDDATVTNCTFTGNQGRGFVINYQDTALLTNSTLTGNVGSDLLSIGGNAIPRNCIVVKLDTQNGFGTITSGGHNLFRSAAPPGMTELASDVSSPGVSSSSTSFGGSLSSGTYYYVIAAVTATETLTSGESPVSVPFNGSTVHLSWKAPVGISGVTGYKIYRGTTLGGEKLIATVSAATTSLTDAGIAGTSSVPLLLGPLQNNGGPVPTVAPNAAGSVFTSNKGSVAFAPFLDETGYFRNPILPGIGAVESASRTPNTVSVSPASLPGIDTGVAYSRSVTASGGTGAGYQFGITAGALPPGLTLTESGTLAGTTTASGSFTFTVSGFDSAGDFGSKSYTLSVNADPTITTSSLAIGTENSAYSQGLLTNGGTGPFTWSYTGMLPSGVTFNTSTGTFGGTPAAGSAGTYSNIQVTPTDTDGASTTQTYSLTVHWVIGLSPALPGDTINFAYDQTQDITGGSGTYSGLSVTGLPTGLMASLSGTSLTISGTPTVAGTFPLSITLHDDGNNSDSNVANENLTVNPPLAITRTSLPNWTETLAYNQTVATTGGTGPLTFSLSAGSLPPGLALNSSTGVIDGTPPKGSAGSYPFTVTVTDAVGANISQQYTVVISSMSLGALSFNEWTAYKTGFIGTIAATTGTGACKVSVASGILPYGMTASVGGGLVTFGGTPVLAGTYTFTLKLTDSLGVTTTQSYTIVINPYTTLVWTGQGGDDNWTTAGNWDGGAAPVAGDSLIFGPGAMQQTANDNFASGTLFGGIRFLDGGYTLTGNNLKLTAGISSSSNAAGTDTVGLNVALIANETFNIVGSTLVDLTGAISGPLFSIVKTGTGVLAFDSPTGNTYTGLTYVMAGTLQFGASNQLVASSTVVVYAGATFDLNGQDQTIGSLVFAGGTVDTGTGTLTLSGNITSYAVSTAVTINGQLDLTGASPGLTVYGTAANDLVIAASISAGSLTKLGPGTLVLSGDSSSYAGTTKVYGGVLEVENSGALGSGSVLVPAGTALELDGDGLTFANALTLGGSTGGATLENVGGSNTWSGPITDAATSALNVNAGTLTIDGPITGAGGLVKSGIGTLVMPDTNSYTGYTLVLAGVLDLQTPSAVGSSAFVEALAPATLQIDGTGLTFSKTLYLTGTLANINGNNTWSGVIDTLAATSTVNVGAGQSLTLSGLIVGAGGLTVNKGGSGTLILTNANTYTGATTIQAGTAVVQNNAALGSTLGGTIVSSGATLQLQGGLTIPEVIVLNGAGAAGTTGALESVAGASKWAGTVYLASASTIAVDAGQMTIGGAIVGPGSLTKTGAGTLIVSSALNAYTGGTMVNGGTLGGGGKIGNVVVNSGATLAPATTTTQVFKTGNVAFSAGSAFNVALQGTAAGTGYDQLSVTGTVNLAGATLNVNLGFTPALGASFTLIQNDGTDAVVGTFAGLSEGATFSLSGMTFQITYRGGTGNDVVLTRIA